MALIPTGIDGADIGEADHRRPPELPADMRVLASTTFVSEKKLNTANLQLEGLVMAVASICEAIVDKGLLTQEELIAALRKAEKSVGENDRRELSDANRAATLLPVRVLLVAAEEHRRGNRPSFSDCAEIVGRASRPPS